MNKRIKKKKAKQQAQIIDMKSWNKALIDLNEEMISVVKSIEDTYKDISKSIEDACKGITKAINEVDWYRIFKECIDSDDNN